MFWGFIPAAPSVNVLGFKANGVENAGYVTVGPTWNWHPASHSKTNQINQSFGDLSSCGVLYSWLVDPDLIDHPVFDPFG